MFVCLFGGGYAYFRSVGPRVVSIVSGGFNQSSNYYYFTHCEVWLIVSLFKSLGPNGILLQILMWGFLWSWFFLWSFSLDSKLLATQSAGAVEYLDCACGDRQTFSSPTWLPVGWWLVLLVDRILMAEQSVTWQLKRSRYLQHFTWALIVLDRRLERSDLINQLIMSSHSTYIIVPTGLFKLLL